MNGGGALMVYRLYFSAPITLSFTSTTISAAAPYTGVLRVALVENRMLPLMNYGTNAATVRQWYDDNKGGNGTIGLARRGLLAVPSFPA